MTDPSDAQALIDFARQSLKAQVVPAVDGRLAYLVHPNTQVSTAIDLDDYRPNPARHTGTARLRSPESFLAYLHQLGVHTGGDWEEQTGYYGNPDDLTVTAVLNDDGGLPGHGDYRAVLTYERTDEWRAWTDANNQLASATTFAEFIEDWRHTIVEPDAASIVDMIRSFKATRKVTWKDEIDDQNGDRSLQFTTETTAGSTRAGTIPIPDLFVVEMPPFIGAEPVQLEARFKYQVDDGGARFGIKLVQPALVLRQAFEAELASLADQLPEGTPIMLGAPAR